MKTCFAELFLLSSSTGFAKPIDPIDIESFTRTAKVMYTRLASQRPKPGTSIIEQMGTLIGEGKKAEVAQLSS
jgi:hypothetical protein